MNLLFQLFAAVTVCLSLSPASFVAADQHGQVIHRDHDGNCLEDESEDDDDCDSESNDEDCHTWVHGQHEIEAGYEDEDLTYEVDHDTSWPSKKENFSEMFR